MASKALNSETWVRPTGLHGCQFSLGDRRIQAREALPALVLLNLQGMAAVDLRRPHSLVQCRGRWLSEASDQTSLALALAVPL